MWHDLSVIQNDDVDFTFDLTVNGEVFDYTNYTLSLVLKASQKVADNTGTTFTVGSGLTATSPARGEVDWNLPHANTATAGTLWWRLDAVDASSNRTTLLLGTLYVQAA